jgi:hypothetical protein
MVFAYAAVSAAQKPRHPFGAGAWFIRRAGHLFLSCVAKSAFIPQGGKADGWVVFPPPNSRARTGEGVIGIMPHGVGLNKCRYL